MNSIWIRESDKSGSFRLGAFSFRMFKILSLHASQKIPVQYCAQLFRHLFKSSHLKRGRGGCPWDGVSGCNLHRMPHNRQETNHKNDDCACTYPRDEYRLIIPRQQYHTAAGVCKQTCMEMHAETVQDKMVLCM